MLVCAYNAQFGTRDRGCSAHPAFPAPSIFEGGKRICITRAKSRREIANAYSLLTSSLRKQGPIRRGGCCLKKWSTALLNQLRPVVMGPCFRRDDTTSVTQRLPPHRQRDQAERADDHAPPGEQHKA